MTIVTLTVFPNGKYHFREIETESRSAFDRIVDVTFQSKFRKSAYLVGANGKLIDSYVK